MVHQRFQKVELLPVPSPCYPVASVVCSTPSPVRFPLGEDGLLEQPPANPAQKLLPGHHPPCEHSGLPSRLLLLTAEAWLVQ